MKITLLQRDIAWADPEENRRRCERAIKALGPADLIVLPEMFSTGFATSPAGIAEKEPCQSLRWMQEIAQERGCAVAGSVALETEGRFVNRFYFVKPDTTFVFYDKHHLFTYSGEDKSYTAGQERVIVEHCGVRIRLLVCYDLRFPVWCRNNGYDLALFVASWPTSRVDAWTTLLKARAIENQCYVVGVNRTGKDPACAYCGCSMAADPYGKVIADCGRDAECAAEAEIDMEKLAAFRKKFPVLNDADAFTLPAIC